MRQLTHLLTACFLVFYACTEPPTTISLAGEWTFQTDSLDQGVANNWYKNDLPETVTLPGSMVDNDKGDEVTVNTHWTGSMWNDSLWYTSDQYARYREPGNVKVSFWLTPKKTFYGPAWYQRTIDIPEDWDGQRVHLNLERAHWETTVWVGDQQVGTENYLATPHVFDLTDYVRPGTNRLTVRVDNRVKDIDPGIDAHSITSNTQSNWNGLVGDLNVETRPAVYLENIRLYPDASNQIVDVVLALHNTTGQPTEAQITLATKGRGAVAGAGKVVKQSHPVSNRDTLRIRYPMGRDVALWDEFHPNLYDLTATLTTEHGTDTQTEVLGMRDFKAEGTRFTVNGRPVFLRGTLECAIFPLTGYPPTDKESWARIFRTIQAHGLNHMRFHSWCPPEAAFDAADEAGVYLQAEASGWTKLGDGEPIDEWLYKEGENILRQYGNHPSFVMMAYGNEPHGEHYLDYLSKYVGHFQQVDPTRVYTTAAGWGHVDHMDYANIPQPRIQRWAEGLKSSINSQPPQTTSDYRDHVAQKDMPIVSHEIGQWCVYPNFKEMEKYTGTQEPRNFEIFQETLNEAGLGHLADSFLLASGKLQALCYKADIEAALRTKGFGGFQLLDLHDFSGQGTALVGVLDAFWEEKGYISPEEFAAFSGVTTPLARFKQRTFLTTDTFSVGLEVAHFGAAPLKTTASWEITDAEGKRFAGATLPNQTIAIDNGIELGVAEVDLSTITAPQKMHLSLTVGDNTNGWDFFVYPAELPAVPANDIRYVTSLDRTTISHLEQGGKAVLQLSRDRMTKAAGSDIALGFSSIFWNTSWTNNQPPHTLGLLTDPLHPAFAHFPTDYHSNWQWWEPLLGSASIIVSELSPDIQPIVRVIDDWFQNRNTGLIFEVKVGEGSLLISGVDLERDLEARTVVRQLRYSLERYMSSDAFSPAVTVSTSDLQGLLK